MRKTETTNGVVREYAYTYDPQAGRFISADPRQLEPAPLQAMRMAEWDYQSGSASAGSMSEERLADWRGRTFEPQDLNRFSYVLNNPLNRVDVDGYGFWRKFFKVVLAVVVIAATSALAGLVFAAIGGTNLGVAAGVGGFTGGSLGLARSAHRNVDDLEGMLVGSMIGTGIGILTGILTYLGGA
ncbi:MAG: hypothetical protein KIT79_09565 [Deltaproteobacteria bacterium]|nr:hypothetical protein [Deltaproteobacteria bacterium]